ncbi:peptidoglycan-binding domain-containing protein [Saccharothrix sp. NPDC042600]|uniref:peptidoglycan-binding domain-containing protein n=1 Tax=Saccharothrix TaxID=2071 RepID=UPI0033C14471|nr:peptidoglycan-binding protein [Saccharothrix mutabilis subsp. capreolus]
MAERRRWVVGGVVALALLGTGTAVALTRVSADRAGAEPERGRPAATAEVERTTLADQQTVTGTVAYGAERPLAGRRPGTVTGLPAAGEVLERGEAVYAVDADPVPLFYGGLPLYRDLSAGVDDGPDVKVVEENLAALGFTGFGTPDEKYTAATAAAVKKWQKANGLEQTGAVGQGDVVVQPGPVRVASVTAQLGAPGAGDLMKVTGTERAVTAELEKSKQRYARTGDKVEVEITGGKPTTGTVTSVTPAAATGSPGEKPKVTVTIALDDPKAAEGVDTASASVLFTVGKREDVLTVPVGALLALAEGGYAVETADDRRLVPVKTGLFAKGRVEITGEGVTEGLKVVTTS